MNKAVADVVAERERQVLVEGWNAAHDDEHFADQLAVAGACYAVAGSQWSLELAANGVPHMWPWSDDWWKPKDRRRNLVRAAALIIAEIERLDRLSSSGDASNG